MKTYAYLRVSTLKNQTTDNQKKAIEDAGFKIDECYSDDGVSGTKAALKRPEFARMAEALNTGDTCIVTAIDRLGRNAEDILHTIGEFRRKGVKVRVMQLDGVDLNSVVGKLLVAMLSAVAEMERDFNVERTKAGLARTKANGTVLGPPLKIAPDVLAEMCVMNKSGATLQVLKDRFGMSRNTINANISKWKNALPEYTKEYNSRMQQYEMKRAA